MSQLDRVVGPELFTDRMLSDATYLDWAAAGIVCLISNPRPTLPSRQLSVTKKNHSDLNQNISRDNPSTVESRYNVLPGRSENVRCIRTENFSLREIGTWEEVRYKGEYVISGVRCNAILL